MGVTGGNFVIAETGSVAIVTNEGNEGMCTVMPRVHVAITGIEKVLPTLEDLATAIASAAAFGDRPGDIELLLGADRAAWSGRPGWPRAHVRGAGRRWSDWADRRRLQEMLRCIRCGACMNHCPVYQKVGGHRTAGFIRGRWAPC